MVGYCCAVWLAVAQQGICTHLTVVRATPWATGAIEAAFLLEALLTAVAPRWSCIVVCIML
jgi:hypothetical protein